MNDESTFWNEPQLWVQRRVVPALRQLCEMADAVLANPKSQQQLPIGSTNIDDAFSNALYLETTPSLWPEPRWPEENSGLHFLMLLDAWIEERRVQEPRPGGVKRKLAEAEWDGVDSRQVKFPRHQGNPSLAEWQNRTPSATGVWHNVEHHYAPQHEITPGRRLSQDREIACRAAVADPGGQTPGVAVNGVDEKSNKPGEQAFEKLISGRYLGEILRLVICELIDEGVLFLGQNTYKLEIPYALDTAFLSLIESDPTEELLMIIGIFSHFFALETTLAERQFFRALAKLVGRRAARLSACGIAAIVSKMGYLESGCSVGADGSLYNKYPGFADRVHEGLQDIFGDKGRNIVTYRAEDGSGVGSAIIAAMTKSRKDGGLHLNV